MCEMILYYLNTDYALKSYAVNSRATTKKTKQR